jgi:uncharacterized membrane protein
MFNTRKSLIVAVLTAAVGAGYVAGSIAHSPSATAQALTVPVAPMNMARDKRKDIHLIYMAARHLRMAAKILARGEREYGGHRVAALEATRHALEQCKAAIMFVRHHHPNNGH